MPTDTLSYTDMPCPRYIDSIPEGRDNAGISIDTDLDNAIASYGNITATGTYETSAPAWQEGIGGTPRPEHIGNNSWIMAAISIMFIVMLLCLRHYRRVFSTLAQELWSIRHRANVFDEPTSNDTRVMVILSLQCAMCMGLLSYCFIDTRSSSPPGDILPCVLSLTATFIAYYLFQLAAYGVVGYVFTTPENRLHWLHGFTASQSLLGVSLMLPASVAIFYPTAADYMLIVAGSMYVVARLMFIIKGFRIFYNKIPSLLYFILYLCTLEIIPIFLVYSFALYIVNNVKG